MLSILGLERRPIELDRHCEERSDEATQGPRQAAPRCARNDDVSCASFPPMTTQGVARRIDLFRKVVRSALIGVHSLDQIDVGRANFLFGRSRLQTENLQRSGDAHALVAMVSRASLRSGSRHARSRHRRSSASFCLRRASCSTARLRASSSCRRRDCCFWSARSESALYRRPLAMTASSADGARRVLLERRANARQRTKIPKATGTITKSAKSEPPSSTRYG